MIKTHLENESIFQIFGLAGLCSGLTEAVVINPFEVVKVKLQAERNVALSEVCVHCKHL